MTSDIGSIIDFKQVCWSVCSCSFQADLPNNQQRRTVLGNWEMVPCAIFNSQNSFTKRHVQKKFANTHPRTSQKSQKQQHLDCLDWHFEIFRWGRILVTSCWVSAWPGEPAEPVGFWKYVPVMFEMFRLYLTIYTTSYFWMSS